jgi:hypothetical protein
LNLYSTHSRLAAKAFQSQPILVGLLHQICPKLLDALDLVLHIAPSLLSCMEWSTVPETLTARRFMVFHNSWLSKWGDRMNLQKSTSPMAD